MKEQRVMLAPSILSADFSNMGRDIRFIAENGGDLIHVDVMDGSFVPDITFGAKMVRDIRPLTELPLDVHLMVTDPDRFIEDFAEAGSDYITIHMESLVHVNRSIQKIKDLGKKAGISIVPSTPVSLIEEILPMVDLVLIMTVNPGFGGQKMIPSCLNKIKKLDEIKKANSYNYLISVDGGVNTSNSAEVRDAGADILISGSAFFSASDPANAAEIMKGILK
ncbi:MAG: ribulose-phosphate 3-epimerase [Spirochaetales bacterium]|nr:ribulose-phosphate 3-epimerase [Spirochaetales bacterium]